MSTTNRAPPPSICWAALISLRERAVPSIPGAFFFLLRKNQEGHKAPLILFILLCEFRTVSRLCSSDR